MVADVLPQIGSADLGILPYVADEMQIKAVAVGGVATDTGTVT
jgi:hypothetical protein